MKILFLMLQMPEEGKGSGMYVDLAEEFARHGHEMTLMAPDNSHHRTYLHSERGMLVLRVRSQETQNVGSMLKKGIALATLGFYFREAFNKFLKSEQFDWIIMPTPPITLSGFVAYVKRKTGARFYLILRDIHPQSIWSLGILRYKWMYIYLDMKARKGYDCADLIGCMSPSNIDFIKENYQNLNPSKLVLLFNWVKDTGLAALSSDSIREKMGLRGKFVALFGGNLGKGQRIENLVYLARHYKGDESIVFLVIAKGVEKDRLIRIAEQEALHNIKFVDYMPQEEYLACIRSVDLGLISISEKYKVPTCPSKAVSYMSMGIPILAMINSGSDYGTIIEGAGAGYWTEGTDKERTVTLFDKLFSDKALRQRMGHSGREFYIRNCTTTVAYETMMKQIEGVSNGG